MSFLKMFDEVELIFFSQVMHSVCYLVKNSDMIVMTCVSPVRLMVQ